MDDALEASIERVRHHLRRPLAGSRNLLMKNAGNTIPVTDPIPDLPRPPDPHVVVPRRPLPCGHATVSSRNTDLIIAAGLVDQGSHWVVACCFLGQTV